jgi:hypothetical protein
MKGPVLVWEVKLRQSETIQTGGSCCRVFNTGTVFQNPIPCLYFFSLFMYICNLQVDP